MLKKDLLSIYDLKAKEINILLTESLNIKSKKEHFDIFKGKIFGMMFEKPSTRTRISFSTAIVQLGGIPISLEPENLQRKRGESIHDTAIVLSSYLDGLIVRTFKHCDVEEFAKYSTIPIINALSDKEHPCQSLADIMTIMELYNIKIINDLKKIKIVYIGDSNNVSNSLLAISVVLGLNFTIISPKKYLPNKDILSEAFKYASLSDAKIKITSDIYDVKNADVIYTDVWTSMGYESEMEIRKKIFTPYQVNNDLLKMASSECIVLHCLPATRGNEITSEIMYKHKHSIFTQAENRLHSQKAILLYFYANAEREFF
ncbi:MAG: ornithine carbamoyltransferase [Endomicrobium sp.]|jgi:ornithine carbamoyltransferase|nr:ornithine carbamoyltransferase [Endomicrobium sp.]